MKTTVESKAILAGESQPQDWLNPVLWAPDGAWVGQSTGDLSFPPTLPIPLSLPRL